MQSNLCQAFASTPAVVRIATVSQAFESIRVPFALLVRGAPKTSPGMPIMIVPDCLRDSEANSGEDLSKSCRATSGLCAKQSPLQSTPPLVYGCSRSKWLVITRHIRWISRRRHRCEDHSYAHDMGFAAVPPIFGRF
jgi:hypothetical protein